MLEKLKNFDFTILIVSILLSFAGIAVIYSLVFAETDASLALKQVIFLLVGLIFMFFLASLDYRLLAGTGWYLYLGLLALLIIVDLFGKTSGGATRWIDLKVFQLQPSELFKFVSVVFTASFLAKRINRVRFFDLLYIFIILLPPLFLILIEPDLGTALVILFSWIILILFSKLSSRQYYFFFISTAILVSIFAMSVKNIKPFGPLLKEYQRKRIEVFLNPSSDPLHSGYNVMQAEIAIGSGGTFGRGLGQGSQSQLKFLPKPETDFIFSGFSEAFGWAGDMALLVAFTILLIRIISITKSAKDNVGYLLAIGIGATFGFQIVINIGMNVGLAPVTGIPLPFLSAGGSSMITSFIMIGVLESIYIHRKKITF